MLQAGLNIVQVWLWKQKYIIIQEILSIPCVIHWEHLAVKMLSNKLIIVVNFVLKIKNEISAKGSCQDSSTHHVRLRGSKAISSRVKIPL